MKRFAIESRRGAYAALAVLTLVWGSNWIVMKLGLRHADPVTYNLHRTAITIAVLFALLAWQRRRLLPDSWWAALVAGFFQTTLNFGATTMALSAGGAGRTSVLVFTMPFWTILMAWPVLGERLRGAQWVAVALALVGLTLVVEPWHWQGALAPKLWAVLSGFGWAGGTVAIKYFQRHRTFDMVNFMAWQLVLGILLLVPLVAVYPVTATQWDAAYVLELLFSGAIATAVGFVLWIAVLRWLSAGVASLNMLAIPVIALLSSMLLFGERLTALEWTGIAFLGAGLVLVSLLAWQANRGERRDAVAPPLIEGG